MLLSTLRLHRHVYRPSADPSIGLEFGRLRVITKAAMMSVSWNAPAQRIADLPPPSNGPIRCQFALVQAFPVGGPSIMGDLNLGWLRVA